jgi:hypothetical protein
MRAQMKTTATIAAVLLAGSASCALARPDCSVDALMALHVAGVRVTGATAAAATATEPFGPAEAKNPAKLLPFIQQGRKLIIYHGASDPAIPAARSVLFYNDLATVLHSMTKTQASVRLFLVPGMQHCSGGIGPDRFDTLSAIEAWVEHGEVPAAIPASTKPESTAPHSLPLCPYPRQARYSGNGAATDAANWQCAATARQALAR